MQVERSAVSTTVPVRSADFPASGPLGQAFAGALWSPPSLPSILSTRIHLISQPPSKAREGAREWHQPGLDMRVSWLKGINTPAHSSSMNSPSCSSIPVLLPTTCDTSLASDSRGGGEAVEREAHRLGLVRKGRSGKEHRFLPACLLPRRPGEAGDTRTSSLYLWRNRNQPKFSAE